jgi:probable DNA metabolism protein
MEEETAMLTYVYDGSLEGLFTALYEGLFAGEEVAEIADNRLYKPSLFSTAKVIATDPEKARKLRRFLRKRLSRRAFQNIVYCYLSESGMERTILSYLKLLLPGGRKAGGNPQARTREVMAIIDAITKTAQKVAYEVHRFHGFLRFRHIRVHSPACSCANACARACDGELYYAPIEPDHNILALLVPHFTARFANQKWFIHDRRRNLGAYYDGQECRMVNDVAINDELAAALQGKRTGIEGEEEIRCRELWQEYFTAIALEERRNEKLQRQHMPVRYWKYLTEFEGK